MVKGLQKYQSSKLEIEKRSRPFGFEATFYVVVDGRILAKIQVLKVQELWAPTAPLPLDQNECIARHLKISLIPLWSRRIQALALLLGHFMNTQINLISYHTMRIVPVSLRLTVHIDFQGTGGYRKSDVIF